MGLGVSTVTRSSVSVVSISDDGIEFDPLGPELQNNWDLSKGSEDWIGVGATLTPLIDQVYNSLLITADDGTNDRGELSISGLEIGKSYRVSIIARRGAQGTAQSLSSFTWGTFSIQSITTTEYAIYEDDVIATSTSGVSRVFAAGTGSVGDEVYVRQVSIREVL